MNWKKKKKEIDLQQSVQDSEAKLNALKDDVFRIEKELNVLRE